MTNEERAADAAIALESFTLIPSQGPRYAEEPVTERARDLITNLCHLLRAEGVTDVSGEVLNSLAMFETEEAEDD